MKSRQRQTMGRDARVRAASISLARVERCGLVGVLCLAAALITSPGNAEEAEAHGHHAPHRHHVGIAIGGGWRDQHGTTSSGFAFAVEYEYRLLQRVRGWRPRRGRSG